MRSTEDWIFCAAVCPNNNTTDRICGEVNVEIKMIDYDFSVCKVTNYSFVNFESQYSFIGKTDEENSLVF